jgi:hypothetical protein
LQNAKNALSTFAFVRVARQGVPAIYQYREYADAGGLISYDASLTDSYRQVGVHTRAL